MSQGSFITRLFAAFKGSPFYRNFSYHTLTGAIDRHAVLGNSAKFVIASNAVEDAFENRSPIPPRAEDAFLHAIDAAIPQGSSGDEKIKRLEAAAARFASHPSMRTVGDAFTPYMSARASINRLKHCKSARIAGLFRNLDRLEPGTPECYDLAARLAYLLSLITHGSVVTGSERPLRIRATEEDVLEALRTLIRKKLEAGVPEIYELASSRIVGGFIEDEFPGFFQIVAAGDGQRPDALINPFLVRDARYQGEIYRELSAKFGNNEDALVEEASWLCDIMVCCFEDGSAKYFYIKHAALDAFTALAPQLAESDRGRTLIDAATRRLTAFANRERAPSSGYHGADVECAETALAKLSALVSASADSTLP